MATPSFSSLQPLRYLLAVARAGSISAAARELRVSQPSVSNAIKALEAAMVFHKGYLVSGSRRYDVDAYAGRHAIDAGVLRGACHSYSEPTVFRAVTIGGTHRDLTDEGETLLDDFR